MAENRRTKRLSRAADGATSQTAREQWSQLAEQLLSEEQLEKQIARALKVSEGTLRTHIGRI